MTNLDQTTLLAMLGGMFAALMVILAIHKIEDHVKRFVILVYSVGSLIIFGGIWRYIDSGKLLSLGMAFFGIGIIVYTHFVISYKHEGDNDEYNY
jgi:predicted tellurium resistance membrane protein TerC